MKIKMFLTKLKHWEHWPTFVFYVPLIPYFFYKCFREKSLTFFLATNPFILYSGCGSESKFETLSLIPQKLKPISILISEKTNFTIIKNQIKKADLNYPLIVKPDMGFRGYLVKKIDTEEDLKNYFSTLTIPIIVQEFIDYNNEIGVFYHIIPGNSKGKITSITIKKYPKLTGNGINTLSELILADDRAFLYYDLLKNIHKEKMGKIIENNKVITLSNIGNHSKGTQFFNGQELINSDLEHVLDQLNQKINGWFFGRVDLKYESFDDLCQGKNFKIIEINGVISEPTHIYDATQGASYFGAITSIKYHWRVLSEIAVKNHEEYNIEYPKFLPFIRNLRKLSKHVKVLKKLNK